MVAYFEFEQTAPDGALNRFVFKLIDDPTINEARTILAQGGIKNHV
ncbi:MAG: hypothetical protein JWR49_2237, partial [Tardiphaga sp.]|nr:hypothetical protein [Tardiphaga sp.]